MSQPYKFCVDCQYYIETVEECKHPTAAFEVDTTKFLVTGNPADVPYTAYQCCTTMRDSERRCGEQAKYWVDVNEQGMQTMLLPGTGLDPVTAKHPETTWGRVWPWIQPPLVLATLWFMWWVAVQFTEYIERNALPS